MTAHSWSGVEVGGALIMNADGLWENRLGDKTSSGAFQLCHDVHQLRPDPFKPGRLSGMGFANIVLFKESPAYHACSICHCMPLQKPLLHGPAEGLLIWPHCSIS